ncbi:MAG: glycosyltransferase family 39 protein [Bacteroidota bacterium]
MMKNQTPFKILTAAIFILLIVPVLIKDGMFMDGEFYTVVAKNMANGLGTFWHPYFSATWCNSGSNICIEQPPLVWGIQSLFFRTLGNSIYIERLYSFLTAVITALLIVKFWNSLNANNPKIKQFSWLPVLLWIITPVCFWAYQNNVQENTMGIFTLSAVFLVFIGLEREKYSYLFFILAGTFVFFASLSKGIPGLFPIATLGIYWLVTKNISFKKMFLGTLIIIATPIIIYTLILISSQAANDGLSFYFFKRLMGRIEDSHTVTRRGYILYRIFTEQIPAILFCVLILLISKIKKIKIIKTSKTNSLAIMFFLIGLAGSVPLTLTLVQKGFYFAASLPFFGLGFAFLIAPQLNEMLSKINISDKTLKLLNYFSILVLIGAIGFSAMQYGKKRRDIALLDDVYTIGKALPKNITVLVEPNLFNEWSLHTGFMHHFNVSIDCNTKNTYSYFIKDKNSIITIPANYKKIEISTKKYDLYQIK